MYKAAFFKFQKPVRVGLATVFYCMFKDQNKHSFTISTECNLGVVMLFSTDLFRRKGEIEF